MQNHRFSRRYFFYGSLLAGAVPSGGFGSTPSLRALGFKSYNEKLNIAAIGVGTRGPEILRGAAPTENIVALCDVNEQKAAHAFETYPKAARHKDYRKMFDTAGKSFDAVMVATPDHLHTEVALYAMQRGKHVYCEKPLTRTVWEARFLGDAAAKYKVATQMGNQGFNHEGTKTACEILWSGDIGDVSEVHAWTGSIYGGQPDLPATGPEAQPVPATLDWDLWQGPAAVRSFNPLMVNQWRAFQDYSTGGSLGDWIVHVLGPAHLALQLDQASPVSVETVTVEGKNEWLWPLRAHTVFEFPARGDMPPVTIHVYQNMRGDFQNPPGMAEGDRLFPPSNNLAERGRPYVGDAFMQAGRGGPGGMAGRGRGAFPVGAAAANAGRRGGAGPSGAPAGADAAQRAPGNGSVFVGSKGYMATTSRGEGVWLLPASRWADYKLPPQLLPRGVNHQQDWIRACKGGSPGVSEFSVATKYIEWLVLGAIALRVPGKLLWDSKNLRFTNNEQANEFVKPYIRKGWELKV